MKNKSAFTMIELVFVIVVLGILASLAMGRMDRDLRQEASAHILSHIRLTQQLALRDNKHRSDNNSTWQKSYWQIDFNCTSDCKYSVGSDLNLDAFLEMSESAIDPTDGSYIFNISLKDKFGIKTIDSTNCFNTQSIAFDYLGRPDINNSTSSNDFSNIMITDCNLTFTMFTDDDFIIIIESETGHAFIVGQEES